MRALRQRIVQLATDAGEGHIPSSLSVLDLIYVLYDRILAGPDRFILSKGHASLAHLVVLERRGLAGSLDTFCEHDSDYGGHLDSIKIMDVECSTGSLGHGLPQGVGLALGLRTAGSPGRVFVLLGDSEAGEGTLWEAFLLIKKLNLYNITIIIDDNRSADDSLPLPILHGMFTEGFGWPVFHADGHDHQSIYQGLIDRPTTQPQIVVAKTVKGYGIDAMERDPKKWHHAVPKTRAEYDLIQASVR